MDLNDLIKLAGVSVPASVTEEPQGMRKIIALVTPQPTNEQEHDGGFEAATTEPDEEIYDDPLATMGSDADLSLRRYLKAKGDHVTVDETVYPDYTVEDVNEAYAAFKEGKYKSDAQRKAVHAAKAEESVEEATVNEEKRYQIRYLPYDSDKFKIVKGFTSKEEAEKYAKAENFDELADEWNIEAMKEATVTHHDKYIDEADIDENAFNQAAAAAARANKDSFEFNGKTYKTKMDKSTAHKLDDDIDMLRKLAGLA
jgi:hypothetical protein